MVAGTQKRNSNSRKSKLTRHSIQKPYGGRKPPVPVAQTRRIFEAQADPLKYLRVLALLYHARSRASVGCGGSLTGVSAARQHLGIPARRSDRASFQRTAPEHGRVSSWSCCRVATQPCWRRFYFVGRSLLEKERNRCYLVLVSHETGFPW